MAVDESLDRFLSDFYSASDDPDGLTKWLDSFADDAVLVMGKDTATEKSGMLGRPSHPTSTRDPPFR